MVDEEEPVLRVRAALGPERVGAALAALVILVALLGLTATGLLPADRSDPSEPSASGGPAASPDIAGVPLPFVDAFESGDLSAWAEVEGMAIETADPYAGTFAARATATDGQAFIFQEVAARADLMVSVRFKVLAVPSESIYLVRTASTTGTYGAGIYLTSSGTLAFRNSLTGTTTTSEAAPTLDTWHELTLHQVVAGADGRIEVGFDGERVEGLSGIEDLGLEPIGRVQLGDNNDGRTFDVVFDDFVATGGDG